MTIPDLRRSKIRVVKSDRTILIYLVTSPNILKNKLKKCSFEKETMMFLENERNDDMYD